MKCQYKKGFYNQSERSNDLIYLRKRATAGILPLGSYPQTVSPSSLMPRTNFGLPAPVCHDSSSTHGQGPWACDYCQVATFQTYEEACQHEKTCSMNQNILSVESLHSHFHYAQDMTCLDPRRPQPLLLTMPGDKDSLSDRQCYVRSHFVELFAASEADVASRHSKGAQKLYTNQIGIRCKHCAHIYSKDRAERAICYPSSISRIYQTVADMQRFHFAACTAIPSEMKDVYKTLKTTRPRGVGSPQAYWISSAKELGLVDTDNGIRFEPISERPPRYTEYAAPSSPMQTSSVSSISSGCSSSSNGCSSPQKTTMRQEASSPIITQSVSMPPLSPESQSTTQSTQSLAEFEMSSRDSEANMLLALRNSRTDSHDGKQSQ